MAQPKLILASTSPWRKELLERLKIPFTTQSPDVLETPKSGETAQDMARRLALAKAGVVADTLSGARPGAAIQDAVVIGSDQTCTLEGESLRKPKNLDGARRQLLRAAGRTLVFHTAVAVVRRSRDLEIVDRADIEVTLRQLNAAEVDRYLELEPALNCLGGFRAEALGISLFQSIVSDDPTALIGLPLIRTANLLRQAGINPLA